MTEPIHYNYHPAPPPNRDIKPEPDYSQSTGCMIVIIAFLLGWAAHSVIIKLI